MELHYKKGGRRGGGQRGGGQNSEAGSQTLKAKSWMQGTRGQRTEAGGQRLDAGVWRQEAGGQRLEAIWIRRGGPTNERMTGWMNQICPIVLYRNASPSEPLPKSTLMLASKANLAVQDTYEADWSIWLIFY